jgi:signal transduction histidine kinase
MTPHSISRRLIAGVLILELLSALGLVAITTMRESHVRLRAYDMTLRARAVSLTGAVTDAEDAGDHLILAPNNFPISPLDVYQVTDEETGSILGRSAQSPAEAMKTAVLTSEGVFKIRVNGMSYHLVRTQAVHIVDPDRPDGGIKHHVTALFAGSTEHVWVEIKQTIRFYAVASFVVLAFTGCGMAWLLRRQLAPLDALAAEAAGVSTRQWQFVPPESARAVRELVPLTEAIESTLARLRQSFEQQERFTSDAAHELKTGVAIAKSSLQLLAMRTRSVEEYKHGLEVCLKDCLRLENIVQEMLALARVQHGSAAVVASTTQIVNLADCARDAVEKFASVADLRRVTVTVSASGNTNVRLGSEDSAHLCSNLLLNALQHSGPGSEVLIEISCDNGWLNLSIQDQGDGIAPDILPHVFDPFFRGDPSRARHSGGTGLGLSICKAICERAGGSIDIESDVGAGTRVMVRVPAATEPLVVGSTTGATTRSARINAPHANVER